MEAITMFLERMGAEGQVMEIPLFVRDWFSGVAAEVCDRVAAELERNGAEHE